MKKVAIYGYGNLGKGVELAVNETPDMEVFGVFSRRAPETVKTYGATVYKADDILKYKDEVDVVIICGGSAKDLPTMTPQLAQHFNVVDSFDTHKNIPEHFEKVEKAAKKSKHTALISAGWDPGMFSLNRVFATAILPDSRDYTFWGKGVSQGHSDAVRKIEGVVDARQYTVPIDEAIKRVRANEMPEFTTREKHKRVCYVVAERGADKQRIKDEIISMPGYFADYDTTVYFISANEMKNKHNKLPHGGFVITTGKTGQNKEHNHIVEYSLKLDSNPEFTASVLVAYARAVIRNAERKNFGCKTVLDIAPGDLSPLSPEELRERYV
jgi:diaminopimelate dehydrogenase